MLPGGGFLRMRGGLGAMRRTVDHEEASRQDDFAAWILLSTDCSLNDESLFVCEGSG